MHEFDIHVYCCCCVVDSSPEELMKEMDKVLTKHLNEMLGLDADSIMPGKLHNAAMNKLQALGIPVRKYTSF